MKFENHSIVWQSHGIAALEERPQGPPAEGEVSLRVLACGLCGTDSHIVKGEFVGAKSGVVLGHEACGGSMWAPAFDPCRSVSVWLWILTGHAALAFLAWTDERISALT